jgi:hypothetical protein
MTPEQLTNDIRAQYGQLLQQMPWERDNSLGIVYRQLEPRHAKMALWLEKHHGTEISTHNLHFIIECWDQALRDAKLKKKGHTVISYVDKGLSHPESQSNVNPMHMTEYLLKEYLK